MAVTCKKKTQSTSAVLAAKYGETSVTETFNFQSDTPIHDPVEVYAAAFAANPAEFPLVGNAWPLRPTYGLYAKRITPTMVSALGMQWTIQVDYLPLDPGEPNRDGVADDPLAWPKTYRWDWVEHEEAVTEAYNLEAFTGIGRPALTLGPVVNPAGKEYAEGLYRPVRQGVLVVRFNVETVDDVAAIEDKYQSTTNSDTVFGIGPRRWEFIGVEDGDQQYHNGTPYRPVQARVKLTKSTDRQVNSVGFDALNPAGNKLVPAVVEGVTLQGTPTGVPERASEPQFIGVDGRFTDTAQVNTWRFLEEVEYGDLLED